MAFHIAQVKEDGTCIIGLQPIASVPLLVYDLFLNAYMTVLFVKPLMKVGKSVNTKDFKSTRLHDVARRTLVASVVCLLISFGNILTLAILDGRERGVFCLTCCTIDVTINVITIHWVTSNPHTKGNRDQHAISASNPHETMAGTFYEQGEKKKDMYGVGMEHDQSNAGRFVMVGPKDDDDVSESSGKGSIQKTSF